MNRIDELKALADELKKEKENLPEINAFGESNNLSQYDLCIDMLNNCDTDKYTKIKLKELEYCGKDMVEMTASLLLGVDDSLLYDYGIK